MSRIYRLIIAVAAVSFALPAAWGAEKPKVLGTDPSYATLGSLPVEHVGRMKPLDTVAREVVKIVYSRETIRFVGPDGKLIESWEPVAAFLDWSVRPTYWDEKDFLRIDSLELKELLLQEPVRAKLKSIASKSTSSADRKAIATLLESKTIQEGPLARSAENKQLSVGTRQSLANLAMKFKPEYAWVSPADIEAAKFTIDGQTADFETWVRELQKRARRASESLEGTAHFTQIEKRARDLSEKYMHYRVVRDRVLGSDLVLLIVPRPYDKAYLKYLGGVMEGFVSHELSEGSLTRLQEDSAQLLQKYLKNMRQEARQVPGKDAEFDAKLSEWIQESAEWVPLPIILTNEPADLARAGFDSSKIQQLRDAYRAVETSEEDSPGHLDQKAADRLVKAARALGESVNKAQYPTSAMIALETHYNSFGPFFKAPGLYFLGFALLLASLVVPGSLYSQLGWMSRAFYLAGIGSFLAGIGLEIYGFAMRIAISGWAPVTNMYETVIWVSLVSAILGFAFELVYRKTYPAIPAMGGSLVAMIGTLLAANTSLDPGIRSLQPVLRSNLWLSIHVLTEVSSYAAFALAWVLGLFATFFYLTATYRRNVGFRELARPLLIGIPLLAVGLAWYFGVVLKPVSTSTASYSTYESMLPLLPLVAGGVLTGVSLFGMIGEMVGRAMFDPQSWAEKIAANESATPTTLDAKNRKVSKVLEVAANPAIPKDPREASMQATALAIKPISTFIYRAMNVGVLLITAGTCLGGIWADYSWGRFWGWDPKEVWALITLLIYIIPLHGRFAGWINTFGLVMSSLFCFLSVVMAWYGVNAVLGVGLHAYGFMEDGGQGGVALACLGFLTFGGGAWWRRKLAKLPAPGSHESIPGGHGQNDELAMTVN